ncbi:uncharacterized protein LOC106673109 isoform X2 [Cimex lectularius]|nr:uncharacterized protein LOC106673109 isoform X2 [Cimex lectularius]
MSNERMYTETEIHLKMLFENMIQGWLVKYSLKEIIRENKIKECLELEEAILEVPPDVKNVDTITADETIVTLVDCLIEFCKQEMPTFQMISKLAMYLSHLDACKEQICILNNETVFTLKKHLETAMEMLSDQSNEESQTLWCDIVALVGEKVVESRKFVRDSIDIWNKFINRLKCIEHSFSRNIEIHRLNVYKQMQDSGEVLNIAIDKLRQAKSRDHLKTNFDNVNKLLDFYDNNCFEEKYTSDSYGVEFVNACFLLFDMYSAEMAVLRGDTFPKGKPKLPEFNGSSYSENEVEEGNILSESLNDIQLCLDSIQNWLDGYKEITNLMEKEIAFFTGTFVENWLDLKRGEAEFWYNLEKEKLNQRRLRIKNNVYDVRASELRMHDSIISRHKKGLKQMFTSLKLLPHTLYEKIKIINANTLESSNELYNALELNPSQANYYIGMVEALEAAGKAKKNLLREKIEMEVERVTYWTKHSTCSLLKAIRLFGEGGNFSAEEAEMSVRTLIKDLRSMNSLNNEVCKKLSSIQCESPKTKRALTSMHHLVLKADEHNLTKACNSILDNLKRALRIEIFNAKTFINKIQSFSIQARNNTCREFWKNTMNDINFFCKYFEMPITSKKLEHESKSVYRGIYKVEATSRKKSKEMSNSYKPGIRKGRKGSGMSFDFKDGKKGGSFLSVKNSSILIKRIGNQGKKSRKESGRFLTSRENSVEHIEKIDHHEDSDSEEFHFGNFQMDFGSRGNDPQDDVLQAYPHPPLFYYTTYIKSVETDNFLCNTKTLMMDAFNDCKNKLMNLVTKMKGEKKYVLLCGDLLHKYMIKIRKFNLQIEHVWFEMIYGFMCALASLQDGINSLTTKVFESFLCELEAKKDEIIGSFERRVEEEDLAGNKIKELLNQELKPSFGYPLNIELLEGLIVKVLQFSSQESARWKSAIKEFEGVVAEANIKLNEILEETYLKIEDLNTYLIENEYVSEFVRHIYSYMLHLGQKQMKKDVSEYILAKTDAKGRVIDKLEDSEGSFDVILGTKNVDKYIQIILQFIMHITEGQEGILLNDTVLIKFPSSYEELKLKIDEYKTKMERIDTDEMERFKAKCAQKESMLKEWKLKWCHDVKCIRNLYVVNDVFAPLYP